MTQFYKIIISINIGSFPNLKSQYPPIVTIGGYWLFRLKKFLLLREIMNLQVYVYLRRYGLGNLDLRYFNTCVVVIISSLDC